MICQFLQQFRFLNFTKLDRIVALVIKSFEGRALSILFTVPKIQISEINGLKMNLSVAGYKQNAD